MASSSAVLAPTAVTRTAGHIQLVRANTWKVTSGQPLADFFGANGPDHITRYDWCRLKGVEYNRELISIVPVQAQTMQGEGRKQHNLADLLDLTVEGARLARQASTLLKPHTRPVYTMRLACRGVGGNCKAQCGGEGQCIHGCTNSYKKGHRCSARVTITATLDNILNSVRLVTFHGCHTPAGVDATPPDLLALRPDRAVAQTVVYDCMEGAAPPPPPMLANRPHSLKYTHLPRAGRETPSTALQKQATAMRRAAQTRWVASGGQESPPPIWNGRFNPHRHVLRNQLAYARRHSRGGPAAVALGDWERTNSLIYDHLIQRGCVLEFEELSDGVGCLVLANPWSLQVMLLTLAQKNADL